MTLEIYKLTMFLICVSIGIQFVELSGIVPDTRTGYSDAYYNAGINGTLRNIAGSYMFGDTVPQSLGYFALELAIFGLLVYTLPFMLALFWYGYMIGGYMILKLPLENYIELRAGLLLLLSITYMVGYKQYQANVSLKQF